MADAVFENKKERFLELRAKGAFKDAFDKELNIETLRRQQEGSNARFSTAGRVVAKRRMGKIIFSQLFDFSGKIQLYLQRENGSEESSPQANAVNARDMKTASTSGRESTADRASAATFEQGSFQSFLDDVSVGDFIGVTGELFQTKTGELTLRVSNWTMLNKSLRTLPEKFHGITDQETIYRKRYLDLISNDESRVVFTKPIQMVRTLRRFLEDHDFLEVETPVLQTQASGAMARPFYTHHNSLGIECALRIAPETYLKRCIGAGMDRVFEFARCFRNEGISHSHLQDFTMLEFYAAYWNSTIMREFVARMMRQLIESVFGHVEVSIGGHKIDFGSQWSVYDYCDLIEKDCGININKASTKDLLLQEVHAKGLRLEDEDKASWATLVDLLYKKVSRPKLIQPTFIVKYPAAMAPLARRNKDDEKYVDLFQFVVAGVELVKAYSELVDPVDQRERFEQQSNARESGDEETIPMDEDYLAAMEHGFPPIAGVGIGIDRLVMILCGCENIKDTVLFPLMRPEAAHHAAEIGQDSHE